MRFELFGPFTYPVKDGGVDRSAAGKRELLSQFEQSRVGLGTAQGCYVVASAGPNGRLPQYVGKSIAQGFGQECTAQHVYHHVRDAFERARRPPQLFLAARVTPKGRFARLGANGAPDINFLETFLIGLALDRNEYLGNRRGTRYLRQLSVVGFLNAGQGQPPLPAQAFRRLLDR